MTITTVGYGDITPLTDIEKMYVFFCCLVCIYMPAIDRSLSARRYSILSMLIGALIFAMISGKTHEVSIQNEKLCIKNEKFCTKNERFFIKNDVNFSGEMASRFMVTKGTVSEFNTKMDEVRQVMMNFVFKMMNFVIKNDEFLLFSSDDGG